MKTVWSAYLESLDSKKSKAVQDVLNMAEQFVPDAEAVMSYAMPTLKSKGKSVISVAAWKNHLAIYPHGMQPAQLVIGKIKNGVVDKSAIKFSYEVLPTKDELATIIGVKLRSME